MKRHKAKLYKSFNLYPGEGRTALLFCLLAFFWSFASYCGVMLADGFFLQYLGADLLPTAFFFTSLGLFAFAFLSLRSFHLLKPRNAYLAILFCAILGYGLALLFFPVFEQTPLFWIIFKVFSNVFVILLTTGFWSFLDQYFHLQHAKRLYTLFGASVFFGNMCGSLAIVFGLETFSFMGLLTVVLFLLLTAAWWVTQIAKQIQPLQESEEVEEETQTKISWKALFKQFATSKFALALMVSYLLIQLLNVTCEYTFQSEFSEAFEGKGDEVTLFLSSCTALVSFFNVLLGCFLYSRLAFRLGINNLVLISPCCFLATFFGWTLSSAIFIAVIGVFIVEGVSYLIDENTSHLLLNAVPERLKVRARLAIDSFFEPLGMLLGVAGFLLFDTKWLGLILALISLPVAWWIKTHYRKAVLQNLMKHTPFRRPLKAWLAKSSKKEVHACQFTLLKMLRQEESSHLFAFECLLHFCHKQLLPGMLQHTIQLSMRGKKQLFQLLEHSPFGFHPQVLDLFQRWRQQMTPSHLRHAIDLHLLRSGKITLHSLQGLESIHADEISLALAALPHQASPKEAKKLLKPFLTHSHPKVVFQALQSAALLINQEDREWIIPLTERLSESDNGELRLLVLRVIDHIRLPETLFPLFAATTHLRTNERHELENKVVQWGPMAVDPLIAVLTCKQVTHTVRLSAARTLQRISSKAFQQTLSALLPTLLQQALTYFYYVYQPLLSENHSEYFLLQTALQATFDETIDFFIQLLGIRASIEESHWLSRALHSKNGKIRDQALEMIEKITEGPILKNLRPLIDDRPIAEKLESCLKHVPQLTLPLLLQLLLEGASPAITLLIERLQENTQAAILPLSTHPAREEATCSH